MKAFTIGMTEAAAALNLARNVPTEFAHRMQLLVQRYGFTRGPLTHAALALECIGRNKGPTLASKPWTDDLKNTWHNLH